MADADQGVARAAAPSTDQFAIHYADGTFLVLRPPRVGDTWWVILYGERFTLVGRGQIIG